MAKRKEKREKRKRGKKKIGRRRRVVIHTRWFLVEKRLIKKAAEKMKVSMTALIRVKMVPVAERIMAVKRKRMKRGS